MAGKIYLPSIEACAEYGIPRVGTNPRTKGTKTAPFMSGPQFEKIKIVSSNAAGTGDGDDNTRIDEIKLEFIGNQPYKLNFVTEGEIQKAEFEGGKDDASILDMYIAPNTTDWVNFTSKHEWERPGGLITSLFESVTSLLSTGNGILTKIMNASQAGSGTDTKREQSIVLDQADAYKSSSNIEFTIPFLLWSAGATVDDWVRDVYLPIMLLTAWSYPRRAKTLSAAETSAALSEAQKAQPSNENSPEKNIQDAINKIYPGTRITILDPPSYIRVKHTSGLFTFNRCVISSFNFKYMDPWVKATTSGNLSNMEETLLKKSLPMRAECSLTLRSIEKLYADDWIAMYTSGLGELGSQGGTNVNVSISQSQNTSRPQTTSPPAK
jgi:hypothetical protein